MVLVQGVQLPDHKKLRYAMLKFYGIGHTTAERILATLSINQHAIVGTLTEDQINRLGQHLTTMRIESDLRRKIRADIAHLRSVGTYRGRRHAMGLPVRGQNTQNNSMTARKLNRLDRRGFATTLSPLRQRMPPAQTWTASVVRLGATIISRLPKFL
ncbi:hypothetical protein PYCC9005_001279 [Savitreella phatthalungensis]